MSGLNIVLNCTDGPEICQFCGAEIPSNDDHECPITDGGIEDEEFVAQLTRKLLARSPGEKLAGQAATMLSLRNRLKDVQGALADEDYDEARKRLSAMVNELPASLFPGGALALVRRDEFNRVFDAIEHKIKINAQIDGSSIIALSEVVALRKESAL
jgi:hypothetical protein